MDKIISKKQFLGSRNIESFKVACEVETIEDWAFAYCKKLTDISIPKTISYVADNAFEGCDNLQNIYVYEGEAVCDRQAPLLAFAVMNFDDFDLVGICNKPLNDWYVEYDRYLSAYIKDVDDKGFQPFLAGGEEDYEDPNNNIDMYRHNQQIRKVHGILLRLESSKEHLCAYDKECVDYLRQHETAVIEDITTHKEKGIHYLQIYKDCGLLTIDNIDRFLSAFEGSIYTECRALLLSCKENMMKLEATNVWDEYNL